MSKPMQLFAGAVVWLVLASGQVYAQASRTWVSGVGDDANPCARAAPCKTFAGAISKTAAGGEISVLDPGGYGAVTITKSISIIARGVEGSITSGPTTAIVINAGPNDEITLHGLTIDGLGSGLNGVRILNGRAVHISNCLIRGFQAAATGRGIAIEPAATTQVHVSDCMLVKNQQGVLVTPQVGGRARVVLNRVTISDSSQQGIRATRAVSEVFMSNSVISGNNVGISVAANANVISFGNNVIANNSTDGVPTQTLPTQ